MTSDAATWLDAWEPATRISWIVARNQIDTHVVPVVLALASAHTRGEQVVTRRDLVKARRSKARTIRLVLARCEAEGLVEQLEGRSARLTRFGHEVAALANERASQREAIAVASGAAI